MALVGFTPHKPDPFVHVYGSGNEFTVPTLYVDDLVLLGGNIGVLKQWTGKLMERSVI